VPLRSFQTGLLVAVRRNGLYVVMAIGVAAIWLALACTPPDAGSPKARPAAKGSTLGGMLSEEKIPPALMIFLFVLCTAGFGIGATADLILFLKYVARKGSASRVAEGPSAEAASAVPWSGGDIARFALIFVFVFTCMQAIVTICLRYRLVARSGAETLALVGGTAGVYALMLCVMRVMLLGRHGLGWGALGLSLRRAGRNAWNGVVGYVAFIPAFFALVVVSLLVCTVLGIKPQAHELVEIFSEERSPLKIAYLVVLAVVLAPVYEELVFRGFVYPVIKKYGGVTKAAVFSSLFFAAIHFNAAQFIPVAGLGMMLAFLYEKTGTLAAPIVFHAINNGVAVAITLLWMYTK